MSFDPDNNDLDDLRAKLIARAEDVAQALLGEPVLSRKGEMRWGSKGSFSLVLRGRRRGQCHDHEAGEGGDLIWLIRRQRGGTFAEAVTWARDFLRMPAAERQTHRPQARRAPARPA